MTTVLESLNAGLHRAMAANPSVFLLGEDVLDPYGGAFKVTRGLSSAYPGRVLTTPVSEAGITGIAAGMALRGLRPVVEIMFGDFVTLIADQVINHIAKFRWMYNDQARVPLVIRTPMGGRRGYGPTHSQTLEKLFLGVPGLTVLAPTILGDPGELLYDAILRGEDPLLFVENKLLYLLPVQEPNPQADFEIHTRTSAGVGDRANGGAAPVYTLTVRGAPIPKLTIYAYGYMAELARQATLRLAYEHEIFCELIIPTLLAPFGNDILVESLRRTARLLVVEEGTRSLGWGAEVLARCAEDPTLKLSAARRLAAMEIPIPASVSLEAASLPDVNSIVTACLEIIRGG
ncbi:MAG: alpha-ketoacid dehydrogenase subunit beta [Anaerolineales bacterium]